MPKPRGWRERQARRRVDQAMSAARLTALKDYHNASVEEMREMTSELERISRQANQNAEALTHLIATLGGEAPFKRRCTHCGTPRTEDGCPHCDRTPDA